MQEITRKNLKKLYKNLEKLRKYQHALAIINFDFETCAPQDSKEAEGDVISFLSNQSFKIATSKEMKELTVYLFEHKDELDDLDKVLINKLYEEYEKTKNVSAETQLKWSKIYNKAYVDWLNAKSNADFSLFAPSLNSIIEMMRENVSLRENAMKDVYDNFLNDYEKGMLQEDLDVFFDELKTGLLELLKKIKNSNKKIRSDFLHREIPVYKQAEFSDYILKLNGYDFKRGCLSTTEHPFTINVAKDDSRVTTHYYENMFISNIFSVIHEGGHAIFMQNQREEDYAHFINDGISNGMHESVSRFYENVIGRSKAYISLIYPELKKVFSAELGDITERELYEAVNIVEPSLIRTEADEVTYGIHIIIRYEIEKMLLSEKISVNDVPSVWNRLYKEYLGVVPENDAKGALQDVHWASDFGYFPSYALGNAYNAMYLRKIKKDMGFDSAVRRGDFDKINGWMKENVFKYANVLTPKEWLKKLTGEDFSAKYFLEYLNEKYSEIYGF